MYEILINCPRCGGDACFMQELNENLTSYICFGCGFLTNSLMKEGNGFYNEQFETLPELYKDLAFEDHEGKIWIPNTINIEDVGMIFCNGTDKNNWGWSVTKAIPILESEKHKFKKPNGDYAKYKMDVDNIKHFEKTDYIEALDYLGLLNDT